MRSSPNSPEQRQHINLSQYAYDIVENDSINFIGVKNISGFINTVIANSKVDSFDDLLLIEEERIFEELSDYLRSGSTYKPTESELKTIKKIAAAHRFHNLNVSRKYPKDVTLKIRLNNKLHSELYPDDSEWEGERYSVSQGEYIKLLIEEYARKPYFQRESVFYKKEIEELNNYISISDSDRRILSISLKDGRKLNCKLYRLSEEYETHYHYLIGLFKEETSTEYDIASIRLSRIADFKFRGRSLGSGKITQNDEKKILNRIKESSIPYLKGIPAQYIVKLTPLGMVMYDYNYSRRPVYKDIHDNHDGTFTMIIKATERQIKNYFFAFGKEAEILSPDEMRIWMNEKYNVAADAYNQ